MRPPYRRMVGRLAAKRARGPRDWSVYVVRCSDGSLYTGVAKDVAARVAKHNSGKGAVYTRARRPVRLLRREPGMTRSNALAREVRIKALSKPRKEALAEGHRL